MKLLMQDQVTYLKWASFLHAGCKETASQGDRSALRDIVLIAYVSLFLHNSFVYSSI